MNSGDPVRPVKDSASRDYYRMDANMRTMTIDADRINLLGYTTINNGFKVNLDGTFEANGATINGSFTANATNQYNNAIIKSEIKDGEVSVMRSIDNGTTWEYVAHITDNEYPDDSFDGSFAVYDSSGNYTGISPQTIQIFDGTDQSIKIEIDKDGSTMTDTNINGDLSVTGDITSNGQSVVLKKKDDASGSTYTISSNNYLSIPYPTGLNGNNVVSISLLDFGTVSGPITILPYGSTGSNWYMIGANGTSITAARFRYWYI